MIKTVTIKINEYRNTAANLLREAERTEKMAARYSHILGYLTHLPQDQIFTGRILSEHCPSITPMAGGMLLKFMSNIYPSIMVEQVEGITHCLIPAHLEG